MSDNRAETNFQILHNQIVGDGSYDASIVVGRLFMTLVFKSKLVGTTYLKEAVLYRYKQADNARISLTKDIYPAVATKLDTTVNRVERAIRNTIYDCHANGKLMTFNEVARTEVIKENYIPTNGELISSMASWLQLERQQNYIK